MRKLAVIREATGSVSTFEISTYGVRRTPTRREIRCQYYMMRAILPRGAPYKIRSSSIRLWYGVMGIAHVFGKERSNRKPRHQSLSSVVQDISPKLYDLSRPISDAVSMSAKTFYRPPLALGTAVATPKSPVPLGEPYRAHATH